jgi:hypothetical protein
MDIAHGPCLPLEGRKKPLAGPFGQRSVTEEQLKSLAEVVAADLEGDCWLREASAGDGKLVIFNPKYRSALAELSRRFQNRPKADRATLQWLDSILPGLVKEWSHRGGPSEFADLDIGAAAGTAKSAEHHGQDLYAWFGPAVPLALSPKSTERLRQSVEDLLTREEDR